MVFALEYSSPELLGKFFTISKIVPMLLFGAYLLSLKRGPGLRSYRVFKPLLILSLYFVVSIFWAPNILFSTLRGLSFILLLISFWLVAHFTQNEDRLRHFIGSFVFVSIVISFLAIISFLIENSGESYIRSGVFRLHAIHTSFIITLGTIPLLVSLLFRKQKIWKWLNLRWYPFFIFINFIGILSTASKTPIVVLIVCFLYLFIFYSRPVFHIRRKLIVGVTVTIALVFAINIYIPILDNFKSRLDYIKYEQYYINNFKINKVGRPLIMAYAIKTFLENPIIGVGLEGFKENQIVSMVYDKQYHTNTHNSVLWALAEGGIVGVTLWLFLLLLSLLSAIKAARISRYIKDVILEEKAVCLLLMLIVTLVSSLSFNIEFNKFFWVILAMVESLWGISNAKLFIVKNMRTSND